MAPNFGAEDVPALLKDFGVEVMVGTDTAKGIVDREGRRVLEAENGPAAVIGKDVTVTLQQGSLPGLAVDGPITVDGVAYKVASILSIEDGELLQVSCRVP